MFGLSRAPRFVFSLATACLALVTFQSGCTCGSGPYQGDYYDGDRPPPIKKVDFVESEKGEPKIIGCADGQREGFADMKKFPRVAGCVGVWDKAKSLREKPTGKACGDDGAKCAVPADVCAQGWHVCGTSGSTEDIRSRADQKGCDSAGPGRFNAAVSHSPTDEVDPCPKIRPTQNMPCIEAGLGAEPVCCGNDCLFGKCKDGVWKGKTRISRGTEEGCGSVTSERNGGVMCCYDGEEPPKPEVEEGKAEAGEPAGATDGAAAAGDEEGKAEEGKAEEGKADAKVGDAAGEAEAKKAGEKKAEEKKAEEKKAEEGKADKKAPAKKGGRPGGKSAGDAKGDDAKGAPPNE